MGSPNEDQYRAAMEQVTEIARRLGEQPGAVLISDLAAAPPNVRAWCRGHAEDFAAPHIRHCPHGGWSQPMFILGRQPNLARCANCDAERNKRLAAELARADTINCDFCGVAYTDYDLHPVVIPFAAVLIRAVGCTGCLAPISHIRSA